MTRSPGCRPRPHPSPAMRVMRTWSLGLGLSATPSQPESKNLNMQDGPTGTVTGTGKPLAAGGRRSGARRSSGWPRQRRPRSQLKCRVGPPARALAAGRPSGCPGVALSLSGRHVQVPLTGAEHHYTPSTSKILVQAHSHCFWRPIYKQRNNLNPGIFKARHIAK
jgi:hypothetical protein